MPYSSRSGDEDRAIDRMFARLEPDVGETVEQTYERNWPDSENVSEGSLIEHFVLR